MTEISIRDLMIELKPLTDPMNFGIGLGFKDYDMEIIHQNHPSDIERQKSDLYFKISRNYISMNITWAKIANSLEDFTGQKDLALQIRRKYCPSEIKQNDEPDLHLADEDTAPNRSRSDNKVDNIAREVGIRPNILDRPCNDETHLLQISKLLNHWPSYAPLLGLTDQEMLGIQRDVTLTAFHSKPHRMLLRWQEKMAFTPHANYRFLLEACLEVHENAELVGKICKLLK